MSQTSAATALAAAQQGIATSGTSSDPTADEVLVLGADGTPFLVPLSSVSGRINVSCAGEVASDVPGSAIVRAGAGAGVSTFTASRACRVTAISASLATDLGADEEVGLRIVTSDRSEVAPDLTIGEAENDVHLVLPTPFSMAAGDTLAVFYLSTVLSAPNAIIVDVEVTYT